MRHTVTNMIGTLPPQFFAVTVTTVMGASNSYACFPCCTFTRHLNIFAVSFMTCSIAFYDTTQVAENLAQLMYSVLMTGYMFRNAQYRLELQQSLEQIALPEPEEEKVSCPPLSPCTSKRYMFMIKRLPCSYPSFL